MILYYLLICTAIENDNEILIDFYVCDRQNRSNVNYIPFQILINRFNNIVEYSKKLFIYIQF